MSKWNADEYKIYTVHPKKNTIVVLEVDIEKHDLNEAIDIFREVSKLMDEMGCEDIGAMLLPSHTSLKIMSKEELKEYQNMITYALDDVHGFFQE